MARKGENIFKRKDGRWEARYIHHYEKGKPKYRYIYASSYVEAKEKRSQERTDLPELMVGSAREPNTFCDLAGVWLENIRHTVRESTFTRYYRIVEKYLLPHMRGQNLKKIDQTYLSDLTGELLDHGGTKGTGLSAKTTTDILCVLKAILRYGREKGFPALDADSVHFPQKTSKVSGIVTEKDRKQMERVIMEDFNLTGLGILFTLFTGVRIGELCGLRWEDINFPDSTVRIRRSVERIADLDPKTQTKTKVVLTLPKTESSVRVIPLQSFLVSVLEQYKREPECYLLTGTTEHMEPHTYYSKYRRYLKKNHLCYYSFHSLRHTFATRCVEAGFDAKALSEILGHSNVTTTLSVYVHPTLQQKRSQMQRLEPECLPEEDTLL